jgi:hypothetical protein
MSFKDKGYVIHKGFFSKDICHLLYTYSKIKVTSSEYKYVYHPEIYSEKWDAMLTNEMQCPNIFSYYGDPIMDSVLVCVQQKMEELTNLSLIPNYTYWRFYEKGDKLRYHKDRKSCEISATICLGYDSSNIDHKKWPMFIEDDSDKAITSSIEFEDTNEVVDVKGIPYEQEPGDIIIYRGADFAHWREPLEGLNHSQLFIHYNDANGPFKNKPPLDGRPILGIPKNTNDYKNKE